jgi:hypothetical protein
MERGTRTLASFSLGEGLGMRANHIGIQHQHLPFHCRLGNSSGELSDRFHPLTEISLTSMRSPFTHLKELV